jgi:hypothetical protein
MNDDEIASILGVAVKKPDWVLISREGSTRRWQTKDASVFAYYFGPERRTHWFGTDYALWVQTADVDAWWRKYWARIEERLTKIRTH